MTDRRNVKVKDKMTLAELLEVDVSRFPVKSGPAALYIERRWVEKGAPSTCKELAAFLDEILRFCPTLGFTYPKVFLKRLKQLQRGEWAPHVEA
jgi:hypothetical protein